MVKHEKIFKNDDDSRVKVIIEMFSHFNKKPTYRVSAYTCQKGKKTWVNVINTESFAYRNLSIIERAKFYRDECTKIVGADRITETANELWNAIKPDLNVNFE